MRFNLFLSPLLVLCLVTPTHLGVAQTIESADNPHPPYAVGFAYSDFNLGYGGNKYRIPYGNGRMLGYTYWTEWYPLTLPRKLRGLGVAIEARDLSMSRPVTSFIKREDTGAGGAIYRLSRFEYYQPYFKGTCGIGSVDFAPLNPRYTHDTRGLWTVAGGLNLHVAEHIWVRADYEYQTWGKLYFGTLHPQGVTGGAVYDFGRWHRASYW